jgi:ubiquinone/menaquinone biosynthesis C-methylase UbiE
MAPDSPAPAPANARDPTFRSYTSSQAKLYASQRLSYPEALYRTVLDHHVATGGHLDSVVDVGCGPGNATRDVARSFKRALGVDPGEAMIAAAREHGGVTREGEEIRYVVGAAEELAGVEGVEAGAVDLVTAAMAVGLLYCFRGCWLSDTGPLV